MDTCLNGDNCHHPFCPDHEVRDLRYKSDWPPLAESDPVFDSYQTLAEYHCMMHYFDVRGGTISW